MFTLLNRLRGTYGYFAKINALLLGSLIYVFFEDWQISIMVGLGYLVGESFGCGEWIGTLITDRKTYEENEEGKNSGIRWLTFLYKDPETEWRDFCYLALFFRGIYWWLPTLAPLYFVGASLGTIALAVSGLALAFPEMCLLAKKYPLNLDLKIVTIKGAWETEEFYYGIVQDIFIGLLIWSML